MKNRHMVDLLFVITLFILFAVSSMAIVAIGADVYESSVESMEDNYTDRTAYQYLTEKLRQYDRDNRIEVASFGDSDALVLSESVYDTDYVTYIYLYDGYIRELVIKKGTDVPPSSGQTVIEAEAFNVKKTSDNLISISLRCPGRDEISFYIASRTVAGGES